MAPFAEGTEVPVAKTRGEIEGLVQKYGATQFSSGWTDKKAMIAFVCQGRLVRFTVDTPDDPWARAQLIKLKNTGWWDKDRIPEDRVKKAIAAEDRRRWRCLLLAIKAKLEIVEGGISTFEAEFLAHIVTADDMTVYERLKALEASGQKVLGPVRE